MHYVDVEVFRNIALDTDGLPLTLTTRAYAESHPVTELFVCRLLVDAECIDLTDAAQRVFDLTAGHPAAGDDALALAYDHRRSEPMRTGDLLRVDGTWIICQRFGWDLAKRAPIVTAPDVPDWLYIPPVDPALARMAAAATPAGIHAADIVLAINGRRIPRPLTVHDVVQRPAGFLDGHDFPHCPIWEVLSANTSEPSRFLRESDYVHIARTRAAVTDRSHALPVA